MDTKADGKVDGEKLAKRRQAAGLTQVALATRAKVDPSLISRIERGATTNPTVAAVKSIARVLGCLADDLLDEPEEAPAAAS